MGAQARREGRRQRRGAERVVVAGRGEVCRRSKDGRGAWTVCKGGKRWRVQQPKLALSLRAHVRRLLHYARRRLEVQHAVQQRMLVLAQTEDESLRPMQRHALLSSGLCRSARESAGGAPTSTERSSRFLELLPSRSSRLLCVLAAGTTGGGIPGSGVATAEVDPDGGFERLSTSLKPLVLDGPGSGATMSMRDGGNLRLLAISTSLRPHDAPS